MTSTERIRRIVRWSLVPAALLYIAWVVVHQWGGDDDDRLFHGATVLASVLLGAIVVAWLMSLRLTRLQRALVPIEAGVVVGALVLGLSTTGQEVDMLADHVAIAVVMGVATAIIAGVVVVMVEGRRAGWAWIAGVIVVLASFGIVVPKAVDWYTTGDNGYDQPAVERDMASFEVLSRLKPEGVVLSSTQADGNPPLAFGYASDLFPGPIDEIGPPEVGASTLDVAAPSPTEDSAAVAEVSAQLPGPWAALVARTDGSLVLELDRRIVGGGIGEARFSLEQGSCTGPPGTDVVKRGTLTNGSATTEVVLAGSLDDLGEHPALRVVVGTGKPLAPVRCTDAVALGGLRLADQDGATTFYADCIAPISEDPATVGALRESSFEDAACAKRFGSLVDAVLGG